jgi:hypothetical protein
LARRVLLASICRLFWRKRSARSASLNQCTASSAELRDFADKRPGNLRLRSQHVSARGATARNRDRDSARPRKGWRRVHCGERRRPSEAEGNAIMAAKKTQAVLVRQSEHQAIEDAAFPHAVQSPYRAGWEHARSEKYGRNAPNGHKRSRESNTLMPQLPRLRRVMTMRLVATKL